MQKNSKDDGLLEWGSATGDFQNAQYETGWDDNLHFAGAHMRETTMDVYAIDLSSMWSMDTHYLAMIASFVGHESDAAHFRNEQMAMNRLIYESLWNASMNACIAAGFGTTRCRTHRCRPGCVSDAPDADELLPPLSAGAPDAARARERVLQNAHRPEKILGPISSAHPGLR